MKKNKFRTKKCRICSENKLHEFLSLGAMPLPNGFLEAKEIGQKELSYPLGVCVCLECGLVQLTHVVPSELMFKNYLYIPSTSTTMLKHFSALADDTVTRYSLKKTDLVVDIGSNDGTLLKYFKANQVRVLGIDPAENLVKIAQLNGIEAIEGYFTRKTAKEIVRKYGKAKVITATNVLAHVNDLHDFIEGINILLEKNGVFIAEFPYLINLLKNNEFDTIYHEHLSYFSLLPLKRLFNYYNLEILSVTNIPVHGGSIRMCVGRANEKIKPESKVKEFLSTEYEMKLTLLKPYVEFAKRVKKIKLNLTETLTKLKKNNKRIIGYGAAAKGNVLLNYCNLDHKTIEYIVDSIPYKQDKFTPGTHISIYPEKKLETDTPDYILLLAWNFAEEILRKQSEYRERGGQFILTVPHLRIF